MTFLTLHIGAHRCASTAIQHLLKANKDSLTQQGISLLYRSQLDQPGPIRALPRLYAKRWFDPFARARLSRLGRELLDIGNAIISEENLCGMMPGQSDYTFYTGKRRLFKAISVLKRDDRLQFRLVLMARRQDRFVESLYAFRVRRGEARSFSEFAGHFKPARMDWNRFVMKAEAHGLSKDLHIGTIEGLSVDLVSDLFGQKLQGALEGNESMMPGHINLWRSLNEQGIAFSCDKQRRALVLALRAHGDVPSQREALLICDDIALAVRPDQIEKALKASQSDPLPRFSEHERQAFLTPLMAVNRIFLARDQVRDDDPTRQRWLNV